MQKIVVSVLCLFILTAIFKEAPAQSLKLVLPIGHNKSINTTSFSPDNKLIVTASDDKTAKIWELPFGRILATLGDHNKPINAITFSPDGQFIFTSSDSVRKFSAKSGRLMCVVKGSFPAYTERIITPDSKTIITTDDDSIYLWEVINGQQMKALKIEGENPGYYGIHASFNGGGDRFLVTDNDKTVHIYRTNNPLETVVLKGHKNSISSAVFSPDDKYILTSSVDRTVKLWEAGTGKLLHTLITYESNPKTSVFSPRSKYIITLSHAYEDSVRIWNTSTGKLICTIKGNYQEFNLNERIFNQDETKVVLKNDNWNECIIVSLPEGKIIHTLRSHTEYVTSSSFGPGDAYLVTTSQDKTATIWDPLTGNTVAMLKGKSGGDNEQAYFSPDNKYYVITADNKQSVWKTGNGNLVKGFFNEGDIIKKSSFSPDNKSLVTITKSNKIRTWNLESGDLMVANLAKSIDFFTASYRGKYHFTADAKKFCIGTTDRGAFIVDPVNGNLLTIIYDRETNRTDFSADGNYVSTISKDSMKIWDGNTGARINQVYLGKIVDSVVFIGNEQLMVFDYEGTIKFFRINETKPYKIIDKTFFSCFDTERTRLVTTHNNGTINIWNLQNPMTPWTWTDEVGEVSNTHIGFKCILSGNRLLFVSGLPYRGLKVLDIEAQKIIADIPGYSGANILDAHFSADYKHVLASLSNGTIKTWRISDGKITGEFNGHTGAVNQVNYLGNEKRLVSISSDNMAKVWEVDTGKELFSFFGINEQDYLTLLPSGYYMSSRNAAKTLYFVTPDLKVVTFEQLDLKYNRPDLVMKMADLPDTALIEAFRKAYEKRVRKMGVDTLSFKEGFSIPQAEFVNRNEIKYNMNEERLVLQIKGIDSTYQLDRFNIWVNEAPLYGQRGISIKKQKTNNIDTTITITLSQGENRIETSITNVNGTESYRMPLQVNYTAAEKQKEMTRFIGIGIDKFSDSQYNLQYSSKDIRDLAKKLKEKYKDDIIIDTLFNENVTVSNIKALKQKLQQTSVNDKVIISYSGHGMLSKEYDYYLSTYAVNFQKPEENGLAYDELENLLDSIPARKKLMLIDACHSGEVDKDERMAMQKMADSLGLTKGIILDGDSTTQTQQLGLKNSFELMQSLFVNVGKSTGATIISAAAGNQFALERGDLKNGVFTYSILEAMEKNSTMKISELKKIVGERVEQLTNGMQKPTSRNETIAVDWSLW